jgi:transposase
MKGDITMSVQTISRAGVLEKLIRKEIKQKKAAKILGLSVRQIKRLVRQYKVEGLEGLIHKGKGKTSNNKADQKKLDLAIEIIKDHYLDFNPTLAHEKLVENHHFSYSLSRLRSEMIKVKLYQPKKRKKAVIYQSRERRAARGELVQLDGSPHKWFEDRAASCNLNVVVDDATGRPFLEFSRSETTQSYFKFLENYISRFGLPAAIYTDRHVIFSNNKSPNLDYRKPSKEDNRHGLTQFGRAMKELGIEHILASTPQAKGRVEKLNLTLQDRLVKEMRLKGISSIEEGNAFLPEFTKKYIDKFSVEPRSKVNMHHRLSRAIDLSKILCVKKVRVLSKNLTCQYKNTLYQIKSNKSAYRLRRMAVTVTKRYDGTVNIFDSKNKPLTFSSLKILKKPRVVHSKQINKTVDGILIKRSQQDRLKKNPWASNPDEFDSQSVYKPLGTI